MIIVGQFAKLEKPFPRIPVPVQSGQVEERRGWSRAPTALGGQGCPAGCGEADPAHHGDEELELPLLRLCSPKGCTVAH